MTSWIWIGIGLAVILAAGLGFLAGLARGRSSLSAAAHREAVTTPRETLSGLAPDPTRAMLQAMPDACLLVDGTGRVVARNAGAAELTGAAEGRPLAATFRVPAVLQAMDRVLAGGAGEHAAFEMSVPVGRTVDAHVSPLSLGRGRDFALVQLRDTTAMTRVERMRADFVANASHELRTPLTSLSGFLETIRGPARDDPEATERFLEIMQTQAERMRRLIDDLLSLSRIELNEHLQPSGESSLEGIVHDVVDAAQLQLQRFGMKVAVTVQDDVPSVLGARDELVQVVQNLLDNAIKYGGDGGSIEIAIAADPTGMVSCSVTDHGPGISREHLPRLTERFYRVDAKASRERGGTGLGLAIVKHIVNRHRGRLEIESEPGRGSRFTVRLPAYAGA